jgi:hypothetical protein
VHDDAEESPAEPDPVHPLGPRCWQVAAGSKQRDYTEEFIRYGLAFVGRGAHRAISRVRPGDRMILKHGTSAIAAVGRVVERGGTCGGTGDKPWLRDFDGWELEAYCHVDWHLPGRPVTVPGLSRGTMRGVQHTGLRERTEELLREWGRAPLPQPEPAPTGPVGDDQIQGVLVRRGLRPAAADELTAALRRIRLLASYYSTECRPEDVREHETRTFLILPLLIALGWPEQRLKVELGISENRRIDVACFQRPYRRDAQGRPNNQDCVVLLESKGFGQGLRKAPEQARGYAREFSSCRCLIVSNGYCYKAYQRDASSGEFSQGPSAYLNLLTPQDAYPLDPVNVKGCLEVLEALMPPG